MSEMMKCKRHKSTNAHGCIDGVWMCAACCLEELTSQPSADAPPARDGEKDFTQSFDGMVWAKAFVERARKDPKIAIDVGTMVGWFANAIMRGFDEHAKRQREERDPRAEQVIEKALMPFADIGVWLFARPEISDDEPVVNFHGINGANSVLTRGDFKRAREALALLRREAGKE